MHMGAMLCSVMLHAMLSAAHPMKTLQLHMVLYKYWVEFLGMLLIHTPPNQKLGDVHKIPLVEGAKQVRKSIYRHSP